MISHWKHLADWLRGRREPSRLDRRLAELRGEAVGPLGVGRWWEVPRLAIGFEQNRREEMTRPGQSEN